ncbi:MAG: phosphoglycerate dehydrogenase [Anaerolineae bacterium]|nr:phosphoglycerate dehydrogenase [Anaerolineae bacterium]
MKYTILVATTLSAEALDFLRNARDVDLQVVDADSAQVRRCIGNADALITRDDLDVDVAMLAVANRLRVVGRAGVGLAGIDVEAATARGVIVMNTPGANAIAAAEYTFALMLALNRHVIPAHLDMQRKIWTRHNHLGRELYGKVLGVIGLGRVGRCVAERAVAFGMEVLAYDPYVSELQVSDLRVKLVGLDEILMRSDVISLHCAATPETYHIIDMDALAQVKPGAQIINTAHGSAIDEEALAVSLQSGEVAGAAIDVFNHESSGDSPLIGLPNVIHTPHMGDSTVEAQRDLSMQIVRQVYDALRGVDYRNAVNMPFMPGRDFEVIAPYLQVAERIGALQHYLARGRIRRVAVEYKGDELDGMVKPLTVALLKGMLAPVLGHSVNYINAPLVAMERGIHVTQAKGLDVADYTNLVSCQVNWEGGGQLVISGALFSRQEPRIVQIDTYRTDFRPEGILLVFGSYDVPGVIGKVGTLMAQHNINIAAWRTGRAEKGGQTLTVLTLDQALSEALLAEFRTLDFVRHATQLVLP